MLLDFFAFALDFAWCELSLHVSRSAVYIDGRIREFKFRIV